MGWISRTAEDDEADVERRHEFLSIKKPRRERVFYHVTERASLPLIRAVGLKPSDDGNAGPGVYLYDDIEWATEFAGNRTHPVILRLRSSLPVHSAQRIKDIGWAKRLGEDIPDDTFNLEHVWVYPTSTFWRPRRMDVAPLAVRAGQHAVSGGWKPLLR